MPISVPTAASEPDRNGTSEIERITRFDQLRYAQCWEDADVLLTALDVQPHHTCLSIASGGDNTLALLSRSPQRVIAIDLSPAQIACLELKVAAFAQLSHPELLVLLGASRSRTLSERHHLYARCRPALSPAARHFWDARPSLIAQGIYPSGRFERYLALFRRWVLPLAHSSVDYWPLLEGMPPTARQDWYRHHWDTWRWRLLFRAFFSRFTLGHLGTDPQFLRYGEQALADHLLERTRYALTELDPAQNPYLHWIVLGQYGKVLPYALRPENFAPIRSNLHRLEWQVTSLEAFVTHCASPIDRFNLSNVFEYMSESSYHCQLAQLHRIAAPAARLAYWNRLVDRTRPQQLSPLWTPMTPLAEELHRQDQVFFYRRFVVEESRIHRAAK